jgi:TRAP-type uncharacterized transport system fused permease subunit
MTLRARILWVVAILFTVANLVFVVMAAVGEEQLHTDIHVALLFVGAYFVWRLAPRRVASR